MNVGLFLAGYKVVTGGISVGKIIKSLAEEQELGLTDKLLLQSINIRINTLLPLLNQAIILAQNMNSVSTAAIQNARTLVAQVTNFLISHFEGKKFKASSNFSTELQYYKEELEFINSTLQSSILLQKVYKNSSGGIPSVSAVLKASHKLCATQNITGTIFISKGEFYINLIQNPIFGGNKIRGGLESYFAERNQNIWFKIAGRYTIEIFPQILKGGHSGGTSKSRVKIGKNKKILHEIHQSRPEVKTVDTEEHIKQFVRKYEFTLCHELNLQRSTMSQLSLNNKINNLSPNKNLLERNEQSASRNIIDEHNNILDHIENVLLWKPTSDGDFEILKGEKDEFVEKRYCFVFTTLSSENNCSYTFTDIYYLLKLCVFENESNRQFQTNIPNENNIELEKKYNCFSRLGKKDDLLKETIKITEKKDRDPIKEFQRKRLAHLNASDEELFAILE